ncbi:hypothetical protein VIGAN_UM002200, partial [Vigna angularis var. angularis]
DLICVLMNQKLSTIVLAPLYHSQSHFCFWLQATEKKEKRMVTLVGMQIFFYDWINCVWDNITRANGSNRWRILFDLGE